MDGKLPGHCQATPCSSTGKLGPCLSSGREVRDSKRIWDTLKDILSRSTNSEEPLAPVHEDAWEYNMGHVRRGMAVIFNHKDYSPSLELSPRTGTEVDKDKLTETLTHLGFTVTAHDDLDFGEIMDALRGVSKADHKDSDCLLVVVLTHGKSDLLYAHDMSYNPDVLWDGFTAEKCAGLAGKPKMFFVQACRGDRYDDGTSLQAKRPRFSTDNAKKTNFKIPNQADFLVVFSCVPGHYSWRNHIRGSWFIQSLCKVLRQFSEEIDVLNMVTLVNQQVALKYESNRPDDLSQHGKKQVPHVTHTLLRQIYLTAKKIVPGRDSWV